MVIPNSVKKRMDQLEIYLEHLDELNKINEKDFLKDWKTQDIVIRNLQVAIEVCTDIGASIISQKGLKVPETYAQIIEALAKNSILPKDFAEKFKDLIKFRNIIVHEYVNIDYLKAYKNLKRIGEFRKFVSFIVKLLESS